MNNNLTWNDFNSKQNDQIQDKKQQFEHNKVINMSMNLNQWGNTYSKVKDQYHTWRNNNDRRDNHNQQDKTNYENQHKS